MNREQLPPELLLWAKADRSARTWHPLLWHLLDVGAVSLELVTEALPPAILGRCARAFGTSVDEAARWLALLAATHDLGKASPGFQRKWRDCIPTLCAAGFDVPDIDSQPHGVLTADQLVPMLEEAGLPRWLASRAARWVGGHHGRFPSDERLSMLGPAQRGLKPSWAQARRRLFARLRQQVAPQLTRIEAAQRADHALAVLVAGLTSVADWIGSMVERFPFDAAGTDAAEYWARAQERARQAVRALGWRRWLPRELAFHELFNVPPRPLQAMAVQIASTVEAPCLVLVEAPMGVGKTEVALYLAHEFGRRLGHGGFYVALPTQATSNQMFARVRAFLERTIEGPANVQLLHGGAALDETFARIRGVSSDDPDGEDRCNVLAEEWFTRKKRGLLAPFAVGTVDQALLGVLRTRHGFVRLFGLGGKTVVLDEVHAYDTYTSSLIDRLLEWLKALGASVVLLSATLPRARRHALFKAWIGAETESRAEAPYPRITVAAQTAPASRHVDDGVRRRLGVRWLSGSTEAVALELGNAVASGGCAAWICNTVGNAQRAWLALRRLQTRGELPEAIAVDLLHARFPLAERERREQRALAQFGKPGTGARPRSAILVGTQVLEQSLDLDFDLMMSDLAPVDLLLQRSGRVHRHERPDRPRGLAAPSLWLRAPEEEERTEGPELGVSARVYQPSVLLRSWLTLRSRGEVELPADLEPLIESVYGDDPVKATSAELEKRLALEDEKFRKQRGAELFQAGVRLMPPPSGEDDLFADFDAPLEEDAPEVHASLQALTRLGEPSIDLVCLYATANGPALGPGGEPVRLEIEPDRELARALLRQAVSVSDKRVYKPMSAQAAPRGWESSPFLRRHRPLVFENQVTTCGGVVVRNDADLGIVIGDLGVGGNQ